MRNLIYRRNLEKGQVLLIVVLTMVVALTVGLSVASRVSTELRISKQNEESQRAFQAAEAGIQQSLRNQQPNTGDVNLGNSASFNSGFKAEAGKTILVNSGIEVDQDTGADVWLSQYNSNPASNFGEPRLTGSANIYWGKVGTASETQDQCTSSSGGSSPDPKVAPAIEVVVLQQPTSGLSIQKFVYDANCSGRLPGAIAAEVGPHTVNIGGVARQFLYKSPASNLIAYNKGLVMKVIPIFNSTEIAVVDTSNDFPTQGNVIESTGTSGDTVRKIKYYTSLPQLPIEVFPYSILSQ